MRYAEIEKSNIGGIVRYVLPAELADDYKILPSYAVEIALDADVRDGDIYENGKFRRPTVDDLNARYRPDFNRQRDALFTQTAWARERHQDRIDQGINDNENWEEWLAYWEALRDMPAQMEFDAAALKWPEQPK